MHHDHHSVLFGPGDHGGGILGVFNRAQAHFPNDFHSLTGQFLKVRFGQPFFQDHGAAQHFQTSRSIRLKGFGGQDGQGLYAGRVFGPSGQMDFPGRNRGGHPPMEGALQIVDRQLTGSEIAEDRMTVGIDHPGHDGRSGGVYDQGPLRAPEGRLHCRPPVYETVLDKKGIGLKMGLATSPDKSRPMFLT